MTNNNSIVRGSVVVIRSSQTNREKGIVRGVEYDRTYGTQYFVETFSKEWGPEMFWFQENEIYVNE